MESSPLRNRLLVFSAAFLFSTGGAAIKAADFTGWQVASFRSGVAAVVLFLLLPEARRGWSWRILPVSVAYAATLITFVLANRLTTAADAIFLQSTAPLYLLLLGPLLLHEHIRRSDIWYMVVVAAGMMLFFLGAEAPMATAPDPARGNVVAAISGVLYACMLTGFRWLGKHGDGNKGIPTVVLGNLIACVAALPMALPVKAAGAGSVAVILYLGTVQIGIAYTCLTRALRHVPALEAATLLMLEPAMSPVWTWFVHGERPGLWSLAGGAVILSATLVNTWRQSRSLV